MQAVARTLLLVAVFGAIAGACILRFGTGRNGSIQPSQSMNDTAGFRLTSAAFPDGGAIPAAHTCDAAGTPPPLSVSGIPEGTQSLALIVEDPDIPREVKDAQGIAVYDHWVRYGMPAEDGVIPPDDGSAGINSAGSPGYAPPCPPSGYAPAEHRYLFTLYALSQTPSFDTPPTKEELLDAIEGDVIATSSLSGTYERE